MKWTHLYKIISARRERAHRRRVHTDLNSSAFSGTLITTYTGIWVLSDLLKMAAKAQLQRLRVVETRYSVSMVLIWQSRRNLASRSETGTGCSQ